MKLQNSLFLTVVLFFCTAIASSHPVKLTSSLIEYDPETTSLHMECRVFIDDFINSINGSFTNNIDLSNLSKEDKKGIEDYFIKYFPITINDQRFPLKYKDSKVLEEYNVFILKFSQDVLPIQKGDQLCIDNVLFFEEFDYMQTNMITLRIPPFISENYFEATVFDFSLPIEL